MAATTKTLTPTNQTISIPAFTDKPDNRLQTDSTSKLADAVNALNSNKSNKILSMVVEGTTDADGDIAIGLSQSAYSIISCAPDRITSGYYTQWYAVLPYGSSAGNTSYSAKCIGDNMTRLATQNVRFTVDYIQK